ncbi:MAG: tripartite tricarboxylate transporter TctB family protein [Bifidobacterium psychraerophilum]|uniref:tripartite tricarboxylate transporter TctB family protein n=1 Tax=Bifidobacterium psychraerophilum TaxID=218140 RepID=UPI0039EBB6BC
MANRAARRAQARSNQKGIPSQYDQSNGRGRSGMIDEHALQERSRRLQNHESAEWKPSGGTDLDAVQVDQQQRNENPMHMPHSPRQWMRLISWVLIVAACIAFLVIMWLPSVPLWLVITISAVFAVGVLSLFFVGGSPHENPNLDDYGAAV